MRIFEPGNLPVMIVQEEIPDHEVLVVLSDAVCIVRRQLQMDLFAYNDSVRIS